MLISWNRVKKLRPKNTNVHIHLHFSCDLIPQWSGVLKGTVHPKINTQSSPPEDIKSSQEFNVLPSSLSEYPPEPTHSYDEDQRPEEEDDYDPYGPAPTQVTMITEDSFPYATTAESHYAKEDTETMQVRAQVSAPVTVGPINLFFPLMFPLCSHFTLIMKQWRNF